MTRTFTGIVLIAATALAVGACDTGPRTVASEELAADQTLRFPASADVQDLDPPQWAGSTDFAIIPNVFGGLYKLDDSLREVPDVAQGMPQVSADGRTYTFHLRPDARFSNGDPVTASDVEYSMNRIARISISGGNAGDIGPIAGVEDMLAGRTGVLSGISTLGDHTLVVRLSTPSGQWFARLATFPYGWGLVDQKVVEAKGEQTWWQTPAGLIGTGPFRMVSWVPKQYVELEPVANWWGGSTGTLTKVRIDIVPQQADVESRYRQGLYDLINGAATLGGPTGIATHFSGDPSLAKDVHLFPGGDTTVFGFSLAGGPFAGINGRPGREALSLAIDRNRLIKLATPGLFQQPATGGVIAKFLSGYLGDNRDQYARFDPAAARTAYRQWDPDGSLVRTLKLSYTPSRFTTPIARELHNQWMANLGVDVKLQPIDDQTFSDGLDRHRYTLFLRSICPCGTENFPQWWFDVVRRNTGYSDASVDALINAARQRLLDQALPDYLQAERILVSDTVVAPLMYGITIIISKPYVRGAGAAAQNEYPWTEIKILKH